jgi:predicted nucleic acid-binding protein
MLLDTSGLFCFHHKGEPQHAEAVRHFVAASQRLTHNYILAEFITLAQARHLPREAALDFMEDLQDNAMVEVVYIERGLHRDAVQFLRQRLDKTWSLCDAVSFLLMDIYGIREALTTDHHFEQAGCVRLLKP